MQIMKKCLLISSLFLLAACGKNEENVEQTKSTEQTTATVASSSSEAETVETSSTPASSEPKVEVLWSDEKEKALEDFIAHQWGPSFDPPQVYRSYSPENPLNYYGVTVPTTLLKGSSYQMTPDFAGQVPNLIWSENGLVEDGDIALVAVFADTEHTKVTRSPSSHLYLFTIVDGQPQVWITEQNQGNPEKKLYFNRTKNQQLQDFFANLVGNAGTTAATVKENKVDTRNLTVEQVSNWALAYEASTYGGQFTKVDFDAFVTTRNESPDGFVYVEVRENHSSPAMQAAGADPNVSPLAGTYRINAAGQLELLDILTNQYQVVATDYFE